MEKELKDKELWEVYVANIAMRLYDLQISMCPNTSSNRRLNFKDKETREKVAESILKLIFEGK